MTEREHAIVAVALHPFTAMFCRCGAIILHHETIPPSKWQQAAQTHVTEGNAGR